MGNYSFRPRTKLSGRNWNSKELKNRRFKFRSTPESFFRVGEIFSSARKKSTFFGAEETFSTFYSSFEIYFARLEFLNLDALNALKKTKKKRWERVQVQKFLPLSLVRGSIGSASNGRNRFLPLSLVR